MEGPEEHWQYLLNSPCGIQIQISIKHSTEHK